MDANFTEMLEEFMGRALVTWVNLFKNMVGDDGQDYMEVNFNSQNVLKQYLRLTDGVYLNEVMRIIDPNPKVEQIYRNVSDDKILRVQNFSILNRHLRSYYQENLQQLVLMPLPNVAVLGRDPLTEGALEELRRMLLLLLGCAVQCETKETFIQQIQSLNIEIQAELALCIQEVTQDPSAVLPLHYGEICALDGMEFQALLGNLARQIQSLLAQRDIHLERIAELCVQRESAPSPTAPPAGLWDNAPEGLSVQLADNKAKLRRLKQELEDKEDQILDYKQEMQTLEEELKKLQCENRALQGEVRVTRNLRDELDCLRERAAKSEQLQMELKTCTHRLRSLELYRTQLKEQQQYCASLQENRTLLEEQLADSRARCSALRELEKDNLLIRQKLMDMEAERDVERQRVDELLEMNMNLQMDLKRHSFSADVSQSVTHPRVLQLELESDEELQEPKSPRPPEVELKPLSVEVDEASSLRLLGAENENAELRRRLEHLQAEQEALQANSPDVKEALQRQIEKLAKLEEEHQNTLREFQNLKNENTCLKLSLEELEKGRSLEKEMERSAGEAKRDIARGECEGKDMGKEEEAEKAEKKREAMMRVQREDGEGEEVLLRERKEEAKNSTGQKERGEAEGEKSMEKSKSESRAESCESTTDGEKPTQKTEQEEASGQVDKLRQDVQNLSIQLQQTEEEASRQANVIQELHTKLGEQMRKAREAEQRLALLEVENQRLRKAAESLTEARKQIEILQCESMHQEEELMRLRNQAELQKMEAAVNAQLEGERAALERERESLKATIDTLRASVRKGDQLELTNQTLKAELERLGRSLDSARRREEELESEVRENGSEMDSLSRSRDEALLEVTRLEQEKEVCQSELDSQRREQRQKEKEMARLRQQLESTASALEHGNQRACSLEVQHRRVCQELTLLKETCCQLEELQKENHHLKEETAESSTQITTLTQDLESERVKSQTLFNQVAQLNHSLEELNSKFQMATSQLQMQTELSKAAPEVSASLCNSAVREAEENVHSASQRENPEKVEVSTESSGTVSSVKNTITPGDQFQGPESNGHSGGPSSERLLKLEKENAFLQREREVLLSQMAQSQAASISLQENCTKLQDLNTKLQVKYASLSFKHASVLAQHKENEVRCATLEGESKLWQKEKEEYAARCEALRRDHERLTALQQRQETELEELLAKHSRLKSSSRTLEAQNKELEARLKELMESKARLAEAEKAIQVERGLMEKAAQQQAEQEKELERLKTDNERYINLQKEWVQLQSELLAQISVLRSDISATQLERTKLEGELNMLKEQNQQLDLNNVRLNSQYQLLTQLKGNMEEENRHLVEQNQCLAKENRALLERSLESRDQHHLQQREYLDKLNELRREKQKLVEKIMDQYRVLEPGMPVSKQPKKTNWIADRMKKLIKPKGGREGRAQFIAAGSVENLAEMGDAMPSSGLTSGQERDPGSAPGSPSALRRASAQGEPEEQPKVVLRAGRRKLGSRHGWGLGKSKDGSMSQSFSPGDHRTRPTQRFRTPSNALWEIEKDGSPTFSDDGRGESEENLTPEHSDVSRVSSGTEDLHSSFDKPTDSAVLESRPKPGQ